MSIVADIRTVDYHTAGEPFRIVVAGVPEIPGATVLDRRAAASDQAYDAMRRLLCHEPRGHADMYGCFLVPPNDAGAELGVVFWHKDGFSTACGHGTIALGAWLVDSGTVAAAPDGDTEVAIDVPSGRVLARVRCAGGTVQSVAFRNVPSYVLARDIPISTPHGEVPVDLAWGGAVYASVPAAALGLDVRADQLPELIQAGRAVKRALAEHPRTQHADDQRLSGVYGTILHEPLPDTDGGARQRNVTVFADGQVDRSPCGSGTSARLALLTEEGTLPAGAALTHTSIIGTEFTGRVVAQTDEGYVTEIEGMAYRTGDHRFVLDDRDELGYGTVLR